jgi:uncharacterized membrane protein YciS (DUF1049 family)
MIVSLILVLVVTIVAVMISLENTTMIQVSFLGYLVQGPDGLFMLIALGIGVGLGMILMIPPLIGRSWTVMQSKRRIAELERNSPRRTSRKKPSSE